MLQKNNNLKCNKHSFDSDQHYREIYHTNSITFFTIDQQSYPYWTLCHSLPGS